MSPTISPNTLVDVIIPAYGRFDLFKLCLDALPAAMGDLTYHVIIFDNGSPKPEADVFYSQINPKYVVIRNRDNMGFPHACNQAVRWGKSPLLFLLNTDVILEPNSVNLLVRDMDDPAIGVAGMLLTFPDDLAGLNPQIRPSGKVQHVGLASNVTGQIIHPLIGWTVDNPKVQKVRDVLAVTGAAMMTRRILWNKCNGFDEIYGVGTYEECDFQMKVRQLGHSIIVDTKARGVHYTGATAEQYRIAYPLNQNRMTFLSRWMNSMPYTEYVAW